MPVKELQTVALGLIIVFLDVGSPDWVADPIGWLIVLVGIASGKEQLSDYGYLALTGWVCLGLAVVTWPPESVPHLDSTLGYVFSLPTIAFCFMLSDSLTDVTRPEVAGRFRVLCWAYAVVTVLPLVVLLMEWDSLQTPATILAIVVNVAFVLALFSASDEDALAATDEPDGPDDTADAAAEAEPAAEEGKHKA